MADAAPAKNTVVITAVEYAKLRVVLSTAGALLRAMNEVHICENDLRAAVAAWERTEKKP